MDLENVCGTSRINSFGLISCPSSQHYIINGWCSLYLIKMTGDMHMYILFQHNKPIKHPKKTLTADDIARAMRVALKEYNLVTVEAKPQMIMSKQ
jgi:hypothetical protein